MDNETRLQHLSRINRCMKCLSVVVGTSPLTGILGSEVEVEEQMTEFLLSILHAHQGITRMMAVLGSADADVENKYLHSAENALQSLLNRMHHNPDHPLMKMDWRVRGEDSGSAEEPLPEDADLR